MNTTTLAPVILFDLDGTLVDSSGDLGAALNDVRADLDLPALPASRIRNVISGGARAILERGLPELDEHQRLDQVDALLLAYKGHIGGHSDLFPGIAEVLTNIERAGSRWGVVTNKREDLARTVLERLSLVSRSAILIGGDTLARHKPDPLPVQVACERMGVTPDRAVFIGDDPRDIAAGRGAGTRVIAVRWGFHIPETDPDTWGADAVVDSPDELMAACVLPA